MAIILKIFGILQIGFAIFVAAVAASAIHEILAALAFGLGCLCLGIAGVIDRLDDIKAIGGRANLERGQ
ncbi:hypothetical protein PY650_30950 [Rhizobium calliandrae]|uniref:Uncharacterized protein n=1 Tax=Rhizobium calliandrae TaxID=1312182 RepID=A0ABT7KRJ5_9HYPH|nr:hypothetical protein [Rhizobium calliandrae]MDL2409958.1 hypothetical protein [Rhizobium calliandrae]